MSQILVGVDGSPAATTAALWAAHEAAMRNVELTVLHVVHPVREFWPQLAWPAVAVPAAVGEAQLAEGERVLEDSVEVIAKASESRQPRRITTRLCVGAIVPTLAGLTEDKSQMVVVGRRGRGGLRGAPLGSVSTAVVHAAQCPVAVVHNHVSPVQPSGAPIVVGVDGSPASESASHALGQHILYVTLGSGGTAYFVAKRDLSTVLDDIALVRPTDLNFVPRIWEMLFDEFQGQLDRRVTDGADQGTLEVEIVADLREKLVGGRYVSARTSSAPISAELKTWVESFLDMHLVESYGSTEAGPILIDGQVRRPPVTDLKLADVPDRGYFHTDRPHPRGELLVKSDELFAGYYKRPEVTAGVFDPDGYYRTGDLVARLVPAGSSISIDATTTSSRRRGGMRHSVRAPASTRSRSDPKQPNDYRGPGTGRGHLGRGSSVPDGGRILSSTVRSGGHVARPRREHASAVSTALGSDSGSTLTRW
jgi:nucleotide-binding universal stress UspA family protein